jgi:hypothetical protein
MNEQPEVVGFTAKDDDTIAVVRFITTTPDNDVPESHTTVYCGPVGDVRAHIDADAAGEKDLIIEEVMLLFVTPEHFAEELGFSDRAD